MRSFLAATATSLYTALLLALLPVVLLRLLWRSRTEPDYRRRIGERLGFYPVAIADRPIWIHAVSVGELLAAEPLLRALEQRFSGCPILLSTTTPSAARLARQQAGAGRLHVYAPFDLPWVVQRFVRHFRPRLAILMETELWPHQARIFNRAGIPMLLLNARLSQRSARGYARASALSRPMMQSLRLVVAQSAADAARFAELGVAPQALHIGASLKWEWEPDAGMRTQALALRSEWRGAERPIWIAASTHAGEEKLLFEVHASLLQAHPRLLLVLAPRHPLRAAALQRQLQQRGLPSALRSKGDYRAEQTRVLLIDTLGELAMLYGAADMVFVGGSLVPVGGHNFAEPAAWSRALLSGSSVFNFADTAMQLQQAGALRMVPDASALQRAIEELIGDRAACERAGAAARQVLEANRGAGARMLGLIEPLLAESSNAVPG